MVNFHYLMVILVHVVLTLVTTCNVVLNINLILFIILCSESFYAPGLKGPQGASSNRIVRLSICLSVILSRLQTKCNI